MNQLTKDAIAKALTDLLQERPIEKITIKDITDRCGINRQTFYYHFSDIYDLMEWTMDKELRKALGTRCFPNKKILRNSPCLPACKQKNIATRLRDTT